MRKLEPCVRIDPNALLFFAPDGKIEAVFDGHVCLEGDSAPKIDEIGRRILLRYEPAFSVSALVMTARGDATDRC